MSLVLRSGDQRSYLVLASYLFVGFIFILNWFSVVRDECPEATKRLMGHKERSCIMEPSQSLTRLPPSIQFGKQGFLLGGMDFFFGQGKPLGVFNFYGQGYVSCHLSNVKTTDSFWAICPVSECHTTTDLRSVESIILCCFTCLSSNFAPHTNG